MRALDQVSFEINRGEFVAIVGPSGSGKSTLLNLLGCMDEPTSGTLAINGREVQQFTEGERTRYRRSQVGFIFQHFGLIPTLSVFENVALPQVFAGKETPSDIDALLARVKLNHRRDYRPAELSGGEMQRTAIARGLVMRPSILLADEPTGNLDSSASEKILELLKELHAEGLTVLLVTHNRALAGLAQRRISLQDGRIIAANALQPPGQSPKPERATR